MKKLLLLGLLVLSALGLNAGNIKPDSFARNVFNFGKGLGVGATPFAGLIATDMENRGRINKHENSGAYGEESGTFDAIGLAAGGLVVGPCLFNAYFKELGQLWYQVPRSEFQRGSYTAASKRIMRGSKVATALLFAPTVLALADRARIEYEISRSK